MFGKNAKQNEELTFKKANKNDLFLHVKDIHGSHVIICSENPDNDTILCGCEVALLLNGQESGEIQASKVRNIKKGSFIGQVLFASYETYTIRSIREETKKLLKNFR